MYLLLADIEEVQGNDQGLVHQWLSLARNAERDPTWICDNTLFSSWSAVSPISGRLGCFEWKAPPRRFPLTLEADDIVLKKEDKQNVTEIAFKDNLLSKCPPKESDSPFEVYTNKQDEETLNQIHLDVDDSNVKTTKKKVSASKKKFQLF
ncbi:HemY protein [Bartonella schoenbuchensis R1]|uniref:HemY protein n=1 Tax=Bartonella schoenbuchensis (strain DSM 13525 / NCTC 13165 / R1) TaxID=687861 RepID=A0A1S6XS59_BARSR|nr:HemY protein [Bartonella schoenbuchensis R1]